MRFDDAWTPPGARMGVFVAQDAYAAGMTRGELRHRLASRRWRRVLGDALAHTREPDGARLRAAAAAVTWPDSVVCLTTAAALHGIPVRDDGSAHVVVPLARAKRGLLVPHEYPLAPADVMGIGTMSVTTRGRTVIDCLGRLPWEESLDLLAWASSRRIVTVEGLSTWVEAHPTAWGNRQRRRAIERLASGAMSVAEDRLHAILRRAGIRGWVAGASLLEQLGVAAVVDVYFPDVRLVVEVDGRRAHGADRFQSDRTRHNALVAAGCTVLRYTWHDLTERPDWVAGQIAAVRRSLVTGIRALGRS